MSSFLMVVKIYALAKYEEESIFMIAFTIDTNKPIDVIVKCSTSMRQGH